MQFFINHSTTFDTKQDGCFFGIIRDKKDFACWQAWEYVKKTYPIKESERPIGVLIELDAVNFPKELDIDSVLAIAILLTFQKAPELDPKDFEYAGSLVKAVTAGDRRELTSAAGKMLRIFAMAEIPILWLPDMAGGLEKMVANLTPWKACRIGEAAAAVLAEDRNLASFS